MSEDLSASPWPLPRYRPDLEFPAYTYVPGVSPHPHSDPDGHSYGLMSDPVERPSPEHWSDCGMFLRGCDLFNHGFYWEAHEVWEQLWIACGRTGPSADFLKGLIKLAAAGVKVREGRSSPARTHARRAAELFRATQLALPQPTPRFFGLSPLELQDWSEEVAVGMAPLQLPSQTVQSLFPFVLLLSDDVAEPPLLQDAAPSTPAEPVG